MIEYLTKVLLETDGTPDSEAATTLAVALASREGAELHVVHVAYAPFSTTGTTVGGGSLPGQPAGYAEQQARMLLEEGVERIRKAGGDVSGSLRMGQPAQEVVGLSEEMGADLLVIGSGRPRAVRRAPGRHGAPCRPGARLRLRRPQRPLPRTGRPPRRRARRHRPLKRDRRRSKTPQTLHCESGKSRYA